MFQFHMNHEMKSRIIDLWSEDSYVYFNVNIQGGPKVNTHTLGLIAPPWFTFEDNCYFADGVLYRPTCSRIPSSKFENSNN